MHEFKHGELKTGPGGKAGKVRSRRQAIAIALKEGGASKYESESKSARTARKQLRYGRKERDEGDYARSAPQLSRT
jgi:hypothetical protein